MKDTVQVLTDSLYDMWIGLVDSLPRIVAGLLVFLLIYFASRMAGNLIERGARRAIGVGSLPMLLNRLTALVGSVFGIFVSAVVVFPGFKAGDLVAGLGITSVALGFAFKDILQNFLAGILILWRQPFRIGDEVRTGDHEGTVEEVNARSTRIRTYDGQQAVVPNSEIYMQTVLVRTAYPARRVRLVVSIGYNDPLEKARTLIQRELAAEDGVLADPSPWVYVDDLTPAGVNLAVYFWVASAQRSVLSVRDAVNTRVKLALDEAGIEIPIPQVFIPMHRPGDPNSDRA